LPREAALNVIDTAAIWLLAEETTCEYFVTGELIVRREQWVSFGRALDLLDFDQTFVAVARSSPSGIDGPSEAVQIDWVHPAVAQVGIV